MFGIVALSVLFSVPAAAQSSMAPAGAEELSQTRSAQTAPIPKADAKKHRGWFWTGLAMVAGGLALEAIGHRGDEPHKETNGSTVGGALLAGAGAAVLLTTVVHRPATRPSPSVSPTPASHTGEAYSGLHLPDHRSSLTVDRVNQPPRTFSLAMLLKTDSMR